MMIAFVSASLVAGAVHADVLPDPHAHPDEASIGPAPIPVMEQAFWLELPVAPETVGEVEAPDGVRELDRTKPKNGALRTRIYFRAERSVRDGSIRVELAGADPVVVPLNVRTYREDIEEQVKAVSGVDPSVSKQGRSYYTDEMLTVALDNLDAFPELGHRIGARVAFDDMTDEELFAYLPSWSVPRQCYSNWPCPYCGEAIYASSAFYPWRYSKSEPFKAKCPQCEQLFPTNDFLADDFTSGEYSDDGWGWDPGSGRPEDLAGWIAYHNHRARWEGCGGTIERLGLRHLLYDDADAAHKVGVLLARLAYVYPGMNMRWQQVKPRYLRPGRLLVDGNWERNGILVPALRAYDAIFDHIAADQELVDFLRAKDPAIQTPDDVKALIDTYLVQVVGWDWIRRELSGGNMGAREEDLAQFVACANMGPMSDRWIEELFTHAYNSGANKGGFDDETFINTTTREGVVWISALGYAYDYLRSKSNMAEILSRVESPRWEARCDLYDPALYPKFRAELDTWADFVVAGQFGPSYGDSGGPQGARYPTGIPAQLRPAYERAYRRWPTDSIARAIHQAGRRPPDLFEEDIWPQVEAHVKRIGPAPPARSRVMDGVGFVFLESRPEAQDVDERAGIALRYGYGRGHHHNDNLNIELFAKGISLTPELGYPCWAHPMGDTAHVAHHNTGMIDGSRQYTGAISRGDLEMFAAAPEASFADVSAAPTGFPNRMYRRAVCLADAPGGNTYMLDVLRMAGGSVRTVCLHGPPFDGFRSSLTFADAPDEMFAKNIIEVQASQSDGDAFAEWESSESDVWMRVDLPGQAGRRYFTALSAKPDIPPIRYLFAEDEAEDDASEFVTLWQPHGGEPFIEKVERVSVDGAPEGEFAPVAVRVTLAGGQADTFIYTHHADVPLRLGEIEFQGSFGYWSERDGKLRAAHLVNGAYLRKGGLGITDVPPAFTARIASADLSNQTLKLDASLPQDLNAVGKLIHIRAGEHRTAYHIAEVLPPGDTLRLDLSAIIYRSQALGFLSEERQIICEIPPPIEASRGFKPGYYDGAWLTGEDKAARYRVVKVDEDNIHLDRAPDEADFADTDGDGRRMVSIYDMGPGDEVTIRRSEFSRF